jgi:ubiquinol-cytochrome c reductase cytochrome c1 subunit
MKIRKIINGFLGLFLLVHASSSVLASEGASLKKANVDLCDKASLQRGAGLYANYCAGCHSLQYVRFNDLAKDLFVDDKGKVLEKLVNDQLNFTGGKVTDPYLTSLSKKDGQAWFGVSPPDLSLVARSRGKNWIYSYLHSFYTDPKKPWGVNNVVFPDVAMPHVLSGLQGAQKAVFKTVSITDDQGNTFEKQVVDHLEMEIPGSMNKAEYDQAVTDLVNFLAYVAEPHKQEREKLGVWVLLFLVVFTFFAYLLKREYWKDVH